MCDRKQERQNRKQNRFKKNGATHMEDRKSEMRDSEGTREK